MVVCVALKSKIGQWRRLQLTDFVMGAVGFEPTASTV